MFSGCLRNRLNLFSGCLSIFIYQIKPHQTAHDQFQPNHKLGAASAKPFSGCRKQQKSSLKTLLPIFRLPYFKQLLTYHLSLLETQRPPHHHLSYQQMPVRRLFPLPPALGHTQSHPIFGWLRPRLPLSLQFPPCRRL